MANDGGGPRIPRNLRPELERVNTLLTDISTKISSLYDLEDTFTVNVEVKNIDKFSVLEKQMRSAAKVNATLAKNLHQRALIEAQLNERMKASRAERERLIKQITRLNELDLKQQVLKKKNLELTKDETEELKKLVDREDDLVSSMQRVQNILTEEEKKLDSLDGKWSVLGKTLGNQVLGALDRVGVGLTTLAFDAVLFSLEKLKDGFLKVFDLFERTTKAVGQFNLSMGGTTKGLDAARKEAWKVEGQLRSLTGGELGVGLKMWEETSHALGFVGDDFDKVATKATLAGRALGIGGTAAGELSRTFGLMGDTSADVNRNMVSISDAANDAGVSVADFGKEVGSSKNFLASFGKIGKKVFLDSAAFAKRLGVSLQSLERFTEMTDTFESTATAAAKMNTVFGTSINAMELMLEQDPSKRLEMVRQQFRDQGKTWEDMNRQERKFFTQTMNLSEEEAAGVMSNNLTLDEFQKKQEDARKKQVSDEEKIRRGLAETAETLFNFGQAWNEVTQSIAELIKPMLQVFGLVKTGGKEGRTFGQIMKEAFGTLNGFIKSMADDPKTQELISNWAADFKSLAMQVRDFVASGELKKWVDEAVTGVRNVYDTLKDVATVLRERVFTKEHMTMARDIFGFIARNVNKIVGGFLALKTVMGAVSVMSGLNNTIKLLSGGDGLIANLKKFGSGLSDVASKVFPAFTKGGEILSKGFSNLAGALTSNVGELTKSIGGKMGVAGALAAAGLAGWEFGTKLREWFPQIDVWMQKMMDGVTGFFDNLWKKIVHTGFYRTLFGDEAAKAYDRADAAEAAYQRAKMISQPPATVTGPGPGSSGASEVKNFAVPKPAAPAASGIKAVAGDVYLDGNLVGRHLLRGAGSN